MDPYLIIVFGSVFVALTVTFANMSRRRREALADSTRLGEAEDRSRRMKALQSCTQKAAMLRKEGDPDAAIRTMEEWWATEPDVSDGDSLLVGYDVLGIYYATRNRMDEAAPLLIRALTYLENTSDPSVQMMSRIANAHDQLARYYTIKGDPAFAQTYCRRAAERWGEAGDRGRAARSWGIWHANNGEHLVAAERFAEALAHPPANAEAEYRLRLLVQRLITLREAGHSSPSLAVAREVATENAADVVGVVAYQLIAMAFGRVGLFEEADKQLLEAASRDKSPAEEAAIICTRGLILLWQGRLSEILSLCEVHIATAAPVSPRVLSHYASALAETGRFESSAVAYQQAIVQTPVTEPMDKELMIAIKRCGLAMVRIELRQFADAEALLRQAEEGHPSPRLRRFAVPSIRLLIASLTRVVAPQNVISDVGELLNAVEAEMITFPNQTDALWYFDDDLFHLARALFYVGDVDGCRRLLQRFDVANGLSPVMMPMWHYWRGRCHEETGYWDAAITEYGAAVRVAVDPLARHAVAAGERLSRLSRECDADKAVSVQEELSP